MHFSLGLVGLVLFGGAQEAVQELISGKAIAIDWTRRKDDSPHERIGLRFSYSTKGAATLYIHATSNELDLRLKVTDAQGAVLAEDEDSGGCTTPFVRLDLDRPESLTVLVEAASDGEGKGTVSLFEALETAETLAAETEVRATIAHAIELKQRGELEAVRPLLREAVEALLRANGSESSAVVTELLRDLGSKARSIGESQLALEARKRVREFRERAYPPDHADLAKARRSYAIQLDEAGSYVEARELLEQVLATQMRTRPADDLEVLRTRLNLAISIKSLGDLAGARAIEEEVVEAFTKALAEDDDELQSARMNLANTFISLREYGAARSLQEKVVEVRSRTLPPDHVELAVVRLNLATTLYELGQLEASRALQVQALDALTRALSDEHPTLLAAQGNLARTLKRLGSRELALTLERRVHDVLSRTRPPDDLDLATARGNLAVSIRAAGDLEEARRLEEQVLDVRTRRLPDDHPHVQASRVNLALTSRDLGDFEGARALLSQVVELLSRTVSDDDPDLQSARTNLGGTLHALGDLPGALALTRKAIEVWERTYPRDHPDLLDAKSNLGSLLTLEGRFSEAREIFLEVLGERLKSLPEDHPEIDMLRISLAAAHKQLGDLAAARTLEERVLENASTSQETERFFLAEARGNLVWTLLKSGEQEQAGAVALALARHLRARLRAASLRLAPRQAEDLAISLGEHLSTVLFVASGAGGAAASKELGDEAFTLVESARSVASTAHEALRRMMSSASGAAVRAARREIERASAELVRLSASGEAPSQLQGAILAKEQAERRLREAVASFADGSRSTLADPTPHAIAEHLAPDEALVAYWCYEHLDLDSESAPRGEGRRRLLAHVLSTEKGLQCVDLGPRMAVEQAVQRWRDACGILGEGEPGRGVGATSTVSSRTDLRAMGEELRRIVLDPLLHIVGEKERLILILDDVLNLVPFDALPEGNACLGDRFEFELRASASELTRRHRVVTPTNSLLAFGGVDYDSEPLPPPSGSAGDGGAQGAAPRAAIEIPAQEEVSVEDASATLRSLDAAPRTFPRIGGFSPLPASAGEVAEIVALHAAAFGDRSRILTGRGASRAALYSLAPQSSFLHLACHGYFLPDTIPSIRDERPIDAKLGLGRFPTAAEQIRGFAPMVLCGLALAGANRAAEETGGQRGLVTAEELATLDLSRCELVVLSACDTNVGLRRAGQGVASLQKAIHAAGAQSAITSLWKVPDEATRQLMVDFYRRLWVEKKPKHRALWEAKTKLRAALDADGRPQYSPRDWAGWVLTGNPD